MAKKYNDLNYIRLKVNTENPFADTFNLDNLLKDCRNSSIEVPRVFIHKPNILSSNILNQFKPLTPTGVIFFYRKANYQHPGAHIDLNNTSLANDSIYAVNWLIMDDTSKMTWYNLPSNWQENIKMTEAGSGYAEWNINELSQHGEQCDLRNIATLVRVDIPHTVFMGSKERLSISIRFDKKFTSWNNCAEFFDIYFT